MKTFAERLKVAIEKRGLSQAVAARKCGIAQQSISYILNNNLNTSKLGPQIAAALMINPEWLIYGRGKFEETKVYELPILHSPYMLTKFLENRLDLHSVDFTLSEKFLGSTAFAYLLEATKIILCSDMDHFNGSEYLNLTESTAIVSKEKNGLSFPIFEWRTRYESF